jgi:hypothetical protein
MSSPPLRAVLPKASDRLRLADAYDVSPFCLGMVRDEDAVSEAFDAGINFFFVTADMHWPLYEQTRKGLANLLARGGGIRDRIVVAGVSYVAQPEFCYVPFKELINSVPGLGRLDVTLAGATRAHDFPARVAQYRRHIDWGARAFGATFHERPFAAETMATRAVQIGFIRYNAFHRGAEREIFPRVAARSPSLLYNFKSNERLSDAEYEALGLPETYWRPDATDYYRFALARPELDGILCAPRTPKEVVELLESVERGPLTEEEHTYLCDLADVAKGKASLPKG